MNTLTKKLSLISLAGLASLGIMQASAMGFGGFGASNLSADDLASRHTQMFSQEASILGISLDDVKTAWSQGKNIFTLAKEKGISDTDLQTKLQNARLTQMQQNLQALVSKGVITQAQADARLSYVKSNDSDSGRRGGHRGMGMGMGWGF